MPIYSYRNNWERTELRVKLDNDWRGTTPYVYVNGVWKKAFRPVPPGLIVPYNGTTAPAGWSLFTAADNKFIVGAGGAYAVKSTGGGASITASSTSAGAHSGPVFKTGIGFGSARGMNVAGSHSHLVSFNYTPPYYGLTLIKANTELNRLPSKSIVFSDKTLPLSRFTNGDGKLFLAHSVIGAGGSNLIGATTSSSAGNHVHGDKEYSVYSSGPNWNIISSVAHTHSTETFTITPNLKRALLSAWTNASKDFGLEPGMYAFYESLTPPDGWALCDGTNDTLDLRDYFIEFGNENNHGTKTGNGTIYMPNITLASITWRHRHSQNTVYGSSGAVTYHDFADAVHSHTIPASSPTFLPPYYALSIITLKS